MRHGKYDLPLDNSDSTFSTGQSAMSASRSKLPVKVVKLYHSSEVQKITLTYNNFRYPNSPLISPILTILRCCAVPSWPNPSPRNIFRRICLMAGCASTVCGLRSISGLNAGITGTMTTAPIISALPGIRLAACSCLFRLQARCTTTV